MGDLVKTAPYIELALISRMEKILIALAWGLVAISLSQPCVHYNLGVMGKSFDEVTSDFLVSNCVGRPMLFLGLACFISMPAALAWKKPLPVDIAFRCVFSSMLYVWFPVLHIEPGSVLKFGFYGLAIGFTVSFLSVLFASRRIKQGCEKTKGDEKT